MDLATAENKRATSRWPVRAPLLVVAAAICLITGFNLHRLVTARAPRNPWESIEIVEAWRSAQGLPVYELSPGGHATHMYGALAPSVQGELFRWVGTNNVSGRLLSLGSALVIVTLLTIAFAGQRALWYLAFAWAALLGVNHRSGQYFAENRPDMTALMFGAAALFLLAFGQEKKRLLYIVLGSACLAAGFFFKQTVVVFSVAPFFALLLRGQRPHRSEIAWAMCPLALSIGVIAALKLATPTIYHYMIEVPGAYSINWPRAAKFLWELLLDSPLFLVVFGEWLVFGADASRNDARIRWLLAVLAIAIPFSAVSHAKVGGWPNCLLPALLAMTAFCVLRLPALLRHIEHTSAPRLGRFAYATFLAVVLLMTTFPHLTWEHSLIVPRQRLDNEYANAVAAARALPGRVVCPEDPTIPLYAKSFAGQNVFGEKDARAQDGAWPKQTPEPVLVELQSADYVIDVTNYWGENVDDRLLEDAGFVPLEVAGLDPECYRVWRRAGLAARRRVTADRTVLR
jgi:hypothetical protein